MVIEIIPKTKAKKIPRVNIFFYLLLIITFLVVPASYFLLNFFQEKLAEELSGIEKTLERSPSEKTLEENIFSYRKRIQEVEPFINSHRFTVNVFNYLEKITHPKVWFPEFELTPETGEMDIVGEAESFEVLGQQTIIFEKEELIKGVELSKVSIGKEGEIRFELQLTFDPKIFIPR